MGADGGACNVRLCAVRRLPSARYAIRGYANTRRFLHPHATHIPRQGSRAEPVVETLRSCGSYTETGRINKGGIVGLASGDHFTRVNVHRPLMHALRSDRVPIKCAAVTADHGTGCWQLSEFSTTSPATGWTIPWAPRIDSARGWLAPACAQNVPGITHRRQQERLSRPAPRGDCAQNVGPVPPLPIASRQPATT